MKPRRPISPGFRQMAQQLRSGAGRAVSSAVQPTQSLSSVSGKEENPEIPAIGAHTEIMTFFTQPGENFQLYSAENWVKVRFLLETAGPVAISTRQDILPVLSGKGILLPTDVEIEFPLPKGDRIFIASPNVNRVRVIIEPIPWQEQIAVMMASFLKRLIK